MVVILRDDFWVNYFGCKIKLQEPELTLCNSEDAEKMFVQDHWLKDSAYQEWVLKNEVDKNCLRLSMQNSAHF